MKTSASSVAVLWLVLVAAGGCGTACGGEEAHEPEAAPEPATPSAPEIEQPRAAVEIEEPALAPPPAKPSPTEKAPVAAPPSQVRPPRPKPGALLGMVLLEGEAPEPAPIDAAATSWCTEAKDALDFRLEVDPSGGIANVLATIVVEGFEFSSAGKEYSFGHALCEFEPHVSFVPVGATLRFTYSNKEPHEVHVRAEDGRMQLGHAVDSTTAEANAGEPGLLQIRCDLHPWTSSWVLVTRSPFTARTKADGTFELHGLPPGEHALELWHERLGTLEQKVTIEDDASTRVEIRWPAERAR